MIIAIAISGGGWVGSQCLPGSRAVFLVWPSHKPTTVPAKPRAPREICRGIIVFEQGDVMQNIEWLTTDKQERDKDVGRTSCE